MLTGLKLAFKNKWVAFNSIAPRLYIDWLPYRGKEQVQSFPNMFENTEKIEYFSY